MSWPTACPEACGARGFRTVASCSGPAAARGRGRCGAAAPGGRGRAARRAASKRRAIRVGDDALALHPPAPLRVVVAAAVHLADQAHHPLRAVGVVRLEPVAEQRPDLARQAQDDVAGAGRAGVAGGREQRLDLVVVEAGDHRADRDPHRAAGLGQPADRRAAGARARRRAAPSRGRACGRAWSRDSPAAASRSAAIAPRMSASRSISAPLVRIVTGWRKSRSTSSTARMIAEPLLDRLVGVGVGADRDRLEAVAALARARPRARFGASGLAVSRVSKSRPGDRPRKAVGRAGEAVDAAVLAAAVGVDRAVEGDVGALVAGDDRARPLDRHLGRGPGRSPPRCPSRRRRRRGRRRSKRPAMLSPAPRARRAASRHRCQFVSDHRGRLEHKRNIRQRGRGRRARTAPSRFRRRMACRIRLRRLG